MEIPPPLEVDVISDVMCPWCFIGKRRLERAMELVPQRPFEIRWRPFQLDATIPPDGMDRQTYLDRKFGRDQAREIYANIEAVGAAEGIDFAFDRIEKSPNTLDAHRFIRWSANSGHQNQAVERLFAAFFIEGEDIGAKDVLLDVACEIGMDDQIVEQLLDSDADIELVEKEIALAHRMGVNGVPAFVIANRYIVMGAQSPELLADAFKRAADDMVEAPAEGS
ncbi:MAG: DsbA family oxidoreductase [Hyphomicrobiales bacterium]|nr:DsbA family oxidoreductase [Hyphomicrobiales bacterium]